MWNEGGCSNQKLLRKIEMLYVPLLKTLESLLQNEADFCCHHVITKYKIMHHVHSRLKESLMHTVVAHSV